WNKSDRLLFWGAGICNVAVTLAFGIATAKTSEVLVLLQNLFLTQISLGLKKTEI
ncbi:hypothetical protein ACJX0J_021339, partial [Zea mays]